MQPPAALIPDAGVLFRGRPASSRARAARHHDGGPQTVTHPNALTVPRPKLSDAAACFAPTRPTTSRPYHQSIKPPSTFVQGRLCKGVCTRRCERRRVKAMCARPMVQACASDLSAAGPRAYPSVPQDVVLLRRNTALLFVQTVVSVWGGPRLIAIAPQQGAQTHIVST